MFLQLEFAFSDPARAFRGPKGGRELWSECRKEHQTEEQRPQMGTQKDNSWEAKKEDLMATSKEEMFALVHWEKEEDAMATSKEEMYAKFQPWVLATYGDSAKTKTITVRKAARIRALLSTSEKVQIIVI